MALSSLRPSSKYKIIDKEKGKYIVQCSSLRAIMKLSLNNIVSDPTLILGFSSEHACFLGIKVAQSSDKATTLGVASMTKIIQDCNGKYRILSEVRGKKICFIDYDHFQKHIMCPLAIATNTMLINNFSPGHSFYIGYLAGTIAMAKQCSSNLTTDRPVYLRIVK